MKQRWRRLAALGLTLCLALSILAMPAQAVQLETEDPADQIQAEETLAPAEEETQPVDEPETTEAENEDLALLPEEEEEAPVIPAQTRQVPALLTSHVRYMEGFPEGTFQPDKQLTRAQAAQMVYRLLAAPDSGMGPCSYADVPASQWYAKAVTALCRLGLFDDGSQFRPEDIITRAEFVDLLVRLRPEAQGQAVFSDVPAWHWAAQQIGAAVQLGWINGYPDGTFKPNNPITRAEMATIAAKFDAFTQEDISVTKSFSDIKGHWAEQYILRAASRGWVNGYPDGTFKPNNFIKRNEAMTLVNNVLERVVDVEGLRPIEGSSYYNVWSDNSDKNQWYYCAVQEATNSHKCYRVQEKPSPTLPGVYIEEWYIVEKAPDWAALEKTW